MQCPAVVEQEEGLSVSIIGEFLVIGRRTRRRKGGQKWQSRSAQWTGVQLLQQISHRETAKISNPTTQNCGVLAAIARDEQAGRVYSLDDVRVKINRLVYIHIRVIGAMCQIFIYPGDSLSNNKPLLGVNTGIFFLALLKGHDAVLVGMLHKVHLFIQLVVKASRRSLQTEGATSP